MHDFESFGGEQVQESHARTAEGFKVRVRATGLLQIEQSKPRTTGLHPEYGGLMMVKGLLPARAETIDEATLLLKEKVVARLHRAGF